MVEQALHLLRRHVDIMTRMVESDNYVMNAQEVGAIAKILDVAYRIEQDEKREAYLELMRGVKYDAQRSQSPTPLRFPT